MNLIHLLILRGHAPGMNADLHILIFLTLGAVVAFITTSSATGSPGRLTTLILIECIALGILSQLYFPAAIAIGLGWILMLGVIALYHLTENKRPLK